MCNKKYLSLALPASGFTVLILTPTSFIETILILFFSFFIVLWNFPTIPKSLYARPLYIGDIQNSRFETFYINIMNIILALGCAILFEEWVIQGIDQNKNILEITAVIGGNITFSATLQNYLAKFLLSICHKFKLQEEARSRRSSIDIENPDDSSTVHSDTSPHCTDSPNPHSPANEISSPHRRQHSVNQASDFLQQGSFSFHENPTLGTN